MKSSLKTIAIIIAFGLIGLSLKHFLSTWYEAKYTICLAVGIFILYKGRNW